MATQTDHNTIVETGTVAEVQETGHEATAESHSVTHEVTMYAEPIFHIGDFAITNALFTSWIAVIIIIILSIAVRSRVREIPRGIQNFFEVLVDGALGLMDQVTASRKISEKAFPIVFSIFMFILINNWLGIMPFGWLGIIHQGDHGASFIPFLRGGTADVNTTLALAAVSVIGANLFGIFAIGAWKMLNKYVNLKVLGSVFTKVRKDPVILMVAPITFAVGLLEIIGEFAKVASLSLRLFGNVFAGEVLLVAIAGMIAYIAPIPFLFLEVFVGVIQAFIFGILTTVYFTIAAQDHDHDDHEGHEHADEHGAHVLDEVPETSAPTAA